MQQWQANIETRMDVYDQFFRRQEAEQKEMQQTIAQLMREIKQLQEESQHSTLDLADVDLHEKEEGERDYLLGGDHHRVKVSKEASNDRFASYPRPTAKKERSVTRRPASWQVGVAKHDDPVRHESD